MNHLTLSNYYLLFLSHSPALLTLHIATSFLFSRYSDTLLVIYFLCTKKFKFAHHIYNFTYLTHHNSPYSSFTQLTQKFTHHFTHFNHHFTHLTNQYTHLICHFTHLTHHYSIIRQVITLLTKLLISLLILVITLPIFTCHFTHIMLIITHHTHIIC